MPNISDKRQSQHALTLSAALSLLKRFAQYKTDSKLPTHHHLTLDKLRLATAFPSYSLYVQHHVTGILQR